MLLSTQNGKLGWVVKQMLFPIKKLSKQHAVTAILGLILLAAFLVRLTRLGDDLWGDEAFNWFVAKDGFIIAIERIQKDFFPPLYSLMLSGWLSIAPDTEISLRLPGILAGVLSVLAVYRLACLGQKTAQALGTACLLALAPMHVFWSQVARPFAFSSLFVLVALCFAYKVRLDLNESDGRFGLCKQNLIGLWVALTAAVYTHNGAIFFTIALFCVLAIPVLQKHKKAALPQVRLLLAPFVATFVCWLPWAPSLIAQRQYSGQIPYHEPGLGKILPDIIGFVEIPHIWGLPILQYAVTWPLLFLGIWVMLKKRTEWSRFLLAVGVVYPLVLALLYPLEPITGRVFQRSIWLSLVWFVFVAEALNWLGGKVAERFPVKYARSIVFAGILPLFLLAHINEYRLKDIAWAGYAAQLAQESDGRDLFVPIPAIMYAPLHYYADGVIAADKILIPDHLMQWRDDNVPDLLQYIRQTYPAETVDHVWILSSGDPRLRIPYIEGIGIERVIPSVSANPLAVKVPIPAE